jgi:ActR/RegA family two-component response regulator
MKAQEQARSLIIGDDATVRRSLEVSLKTNGYDVDVAETGKEAIKKSKTKLYNLAVAVTHALVIHLILLW